MKATFNQKTESKTFRYILSAMILLFLIFGAETPVSEADDLPEPEAGHAEEGIKIGNVVSRVIDAYESRDPERFMAHVSGDFTGGRIALDSAIRQDFSLLDNIDIRADISNIAVSPDGYFHAVVNYSRSVLSTRSGRQLQDSGMTEIVFESKDGTPRIYAIKNPVLFGVSRASDIASGTILAQQDNEMIGVNENGELTLMPVEEDRQAVDR